MDNQKVLSKGVRFMKNEIVIFENQNVKLEVNMKDETVWLSLEQMVKLFGRDRSVIGKHVRNVIKEEKFAYLHHFAAKLYTKDIIDKYGEKLLSYYKDNKKI